MKCFAILCGLLAVASATPGAVISYQYANPAGVTFRGTGLAPALQVGVAQPVQYAAPAVQQVGVAQPIAAAVQPVQYAAPAVHPVQYAAHAIQPVQYAAPAVQQVGVAQPIAAAVQPVQYAAPAHQVGYVNNQYLTSVPGVANVPVTKLALTQGITQKLVDVAQPAVKNRRVKVRRPALRKEFYDIEHRIIVRPAGSATLELSQPISKEQKGPAVITPTNYQQIAPVVRYGTARQIIDGPGVSPLATAQVALARGALPPAGPGPLPPQQQPEYRSAEPQGPPPQAPQPQGPPQGPPPQQQLRSAAPRLRPLQLRPQGPPQPPPQFRGNDEAIEINAEQGPQQQQQQQQFSQQGPPQQQFSQQGPPQQQFAQQSPPQQQFSQQGPPPQQQQQQQQQQFAQNAPPQQGPPPQGPAPQPLSAPGPAQARGLLNVDMPAELQGRLVELLSARGGTVTEVLNENGAPANQASVLEVADALQDVSLQGGEKITTRRIVLTRPIETIQEVDIQEPATKIHRVAVNTPTYFKTPVQGIAQVPVNVPAVKNVATPFFKTNYAAAPAYAAGPYGVGPYGVGPAY